jgi:predicted ribosome quality control (RQC) complex YloA/Tae2 family protein
MPFPTGARAGETPHDAAKRLFTRARAMDRARATLPARIAALEERATSAKESESIVAGSDRERPRVQPRQPYTCFSSRGGLEIRVGRSAKDNDALTFHASSPDDVWMHAQGAAGSHVVLRWTRDESPPAADLEEAAMLAAWHSRSRGSTVVAVDWTRRKHVRKPRGAAPGSVMVDRAQTVMVRPTAAAVRAIRDRG